MENYTIEPLKGYGDLFFVMSIDDLVRTLGQPSNQEEVDSPFDDDTHVIVLDYDDDAFSAFFENDSVSKLSNLYTMNENSVLFGAKVFDLNRDELVELMKQNGYEEYSEDNEDGYCISYDELNIDFYFDDNQLVEVFWER